MKAAGIAHAGRFSEQALFLAKEAENLLQEALAFLCHAAGEITQLGGDALDDFGNLIAADIDAKQILDSLDRILGEGSNQILVAGEFRNQVRDDFLDIHNTYLRFQFYALMRVLCAYYTQIACRIQVKSPKTVERFGFRGYNTG